MAHEILTEIYTEYASTVNKDEAVIVEEIVKLLNTPNMVPGTLVEQLKERLPQYPAKLIYQTIRKAGKHKNEIIEPNGLFRGK